MKYVLPIIHHWNNTWSRVANYCHLCLASKSFRDINAFRALIIVLVLKPWAGISVIIMLALGFIQIHIDNVNCSLCFPVSSPFTSKIYLIAWTAHSRKYFGVFTTFSRNLLPLSSTNIPIDDVQFDQALDQFITTQNGAQPMLDERCRHPLLQSTNWDKLIASEFSSASPEQLIELTKDADPEQQFDIAVLDAANEFIDQVHLYIEKLPFMTLRKILGGNINDHVETRGFHGYQELSTRRRCAARLARLMLMLCRITDNEATTYSRLIIDDGQLYRAIDAIRSHSLTLEPNLMLPLIQQLLQSLFCQTCDWQSAPHQFMVYRFVIFSNMLINDESGYTFRSPLKISSGLSEIQFWARAMVVFELFRSQWGGVPAPGQDEFISLCQFVTDGFNSPFNSVRELLRLLSVIVGAQPEMPQFYWADDDCRTLSSAVDCFSISIDHLSHMVSQLVLDADHHMKTKLLYGFDLHNFDRVTSGKIFDNLYCNEAGYSFLTDPKNNFRSVSDPFIQYLLSQCRQYFIDSCTDGSIVWNSESVQNYLKAGEEFHEYLLTLLHVSSGQPLRAEEAKSLMLSRTGNSINRSVYWINGQVCLLQRYHKGSSKSGKAKYIARFVASQHTRLCLLYLVLIRPMQR